MINKKIAQVTLLYLVFFLSNPILADQIVISGEQFCPHNCLPNSVKPGYLIEIAQAIFAKAGHSLIYRNMPWTRALKGTRYGEFNGIVGVGPAEAPGFIFPSIRLGVASHRFFTSAESTWHYSNTTSLSGITLGAIQDYSYGEFYYRYINPNIKDTKKVQVIRGLHGLERNLKKLASGRIDALVEDQAVVYHQAIHKKLGIELREAGIADVEDLYIAFSPVGAKSKQYANVLTQGIAELRSNGDLDQILSKYGLKDWEK